MSYRILCNLKGSRAINIEEAHLQTIEKYALFNELLDSNGFVSSDVLEKLRLNVRSLLENSNEDSGLLNLCQDVLFHHNMKAFALHQLILLYIEWQKEKLSDENAVGEAEDNAVGVAEDNAAGEAEENV